jgi:phosphatidylserine/phosphatidylglycerophosphate/cardiolipin synthase-like enzyme
MHAKTMIIDGHEAVVSTGNYGKSFLLKERNYIAHLTEPQDVADLAALFDADWSGQSPNLACTRLIVSPVNSRDRIVELVKSAQKTLLIESMQFDDHAVHDAVIARKQAGVDVQIILADAGWISTNTSVADDLAQNGIAARYLHSPAVHVKSIVVDGTHAYLGSENISYTSLSKNREIGLIVDDAAALQSMQQTFAKDYAEALPFQPAPTDAGTD